jgi:hypothetical protein
MDSKLVVLRRYPAQIHAELARSALEAREITSTIQFGPYSKPVATFDLIVREEDVAAANEILGPEETFSG